MYSCQETRVVRERLRFLGSTCVHIKNDRQLCTSLEEPCKWHQREQEEPTTKLPLRDFMRKKRVVPQKRLQAGSVKGNSKKQDSGDDDDTDNANMSAFEMKRPRRRRNSFSLT